LHYNSAGICESRRYSHKTFRVQHLFLTFDFDFLSMSVLYFAKHAALMIILVYEIRNIHISNDNGFFIFYVDFFFPLLLPRLLPDLTVYMNNMLGVL